MMILMFIIFTACNSRISLHFNNIEPNDVENFKIELNIVIADRICIFVR